MEQAIHSVGLLGADSKELARRLLTIGGNRLELLMVEVQEERERLLHSMLLAFGVAAFGLLAGITLSAAIVVILWHLSPAAVLLTLTVLYVGAAFCLYRKFAGLVRDWQNLPATVDQLRRDRACLEKQLA